MSVDEKTYEDILEEYLERVGKNLVGAILVDDEIQVLGVTLRNKKVNKDKFEEILEKVQVIVKEIKRENTKLSLNSKSIETSDFLILLTQVNEEMILISLFALNAMIDSFIDFTQLASKRLREMTEKLLSRSQDSQINKKSKKKERKTIARLYNCHFCNSTHNINLSKDLLQGKDSFPFPYVFLHSSQEGLRDLLTTLYIDKNFNIRGAEVVQVEDGDIFSEKLTRRITEQLMKQIEDLEKENKELRNLLENLDLKKLRENEKKERGLHKSKVEDNVWKKPDNTIKISFISIVGNKEYKKSVRIDRRRKISDLKKIAKKIFKLPIKSFYVSYGGILLKNSLKILDYGINEGEQIVLIPARYKRK